jgi:hypothetical protein
LGEFLLHHLQHLRPATPRHHDATMSYLVHADSFDLGEVSLAAAKRAAAVQARSDN